MKRFLFLVGVLVVAGCAATSATSPKMPAQRFVVVPRTLSDNGSQFTTTCDGSTTFNLIPQDVAEKLVKDGKLKLPQEGK